MLKTIVKLDGSEEAYNPTKINGWGEWAAANLGDRVDWSAAVMEVVKSMPERASSQELQMALINWLLDQNTWAYYKMAGRLYAVYLRKNFYGVSGIPTIKALQTKMRKDGIMVKFDYSTKEYNELEKVIDHNADLESPHFALHHIRNKYALRNRLTNKEYETPQFVYMRMAMALAEKEPREKRMEHVKNYYQLFKDKILSAPTPNYVNLGTVHRGFASCCLFTTDDTAQSVSIANYIGDTMTQASAGIGYNLITRSIGDPIRNGLIIHQGKLPYFAAMGKSVLSNLQNGRGGAVTAYYNCFDPEVEVITELRNPRSTDDKRNRDLHYNMIVNKTFARAAAAKKDIFTWNVQSHPDLHEAFYSGDPEKFDKLYQEHLEKPYKKNWVSARKILLASLTQAYETGTAYLTFIDEVNHHTPFKDTIYCSNLCAEILEPTKPWYNMQDLFIEEDHGRGEIATCSLAAINVANVHDLAMYRKACYYALKMIDYCIYNSDYAFPHLKLTATSRMSAGVGIMGLATHMAKQRLQYSSQAGKRELHFVAERHMYCLIEASLEIAKERGNAPWIDRTKWVDGWLPIDTYNKNVDTIVDGGFDLTFPWEKLRKRIKENKGIAHSVVCSFMPGEASSKALGETNSLYPARRAAIFKSDGNTVIQWAAPNSDDPSFAYEFAWDISTKDMIDCYAIFQKWTDQGISADLYRRIVGSETISSNEMIKDFLYMVKMGLKTRYYQNTETSASLDLTDLQKAFENTDGSMTCGSGGCTL